MHLHKFFENLPTIKLNTHHVGDCDRHLYLLMSGYVREMSSDPLGRVEPSGKPRAVSHAVHGPGTIFGFVGEQFETLSKVEIKMLCLNHNPLTPECATEVAAIQNAQIRFHVQLVTAQRMRTPGATAAMLLLLHDAVGADGRFEFRLTHEVVASFVGTSREIVTYNLNKLRRLGALKLRPRLLLDEQKLRTTVLKARKAAA